MAGLVLTVGGAGVAGLLTWNIMMGGGSLPHSSNRMVRTWSLSTFGVRPCATIFASAFSFDCACRARFDAP